MMDNGVFNAAASFFSDGGLGLKLTDAFLVGINIFNAFVLVTHLHPVESPLKKPFLNAKLHVVTRVHARPFLVCVPLGLLLSTTTCSVIHYHFSSNPAALLRAVVAGYTFMCTCIFIKLSNQMIKLSPERILMMETEVARHDIVNFTPPSKAIMNALVVPNKLFLPVDAVGTERIPDGVPHLFVSNHSLYGIEMPLLLNHLYQQKGIFLRGLADHIHFATPNGPVLRAFGAVDGTRDNVDALMEAGADVLVYPGGGQEVLKPSSVPRYELMWKQRVGFARCAIKHGYPILPCACVGTEDMFDNIGDIPTGYRGMVIPISIANPRRVQKVYFWFGNPIPTTQYNREFTNDDFAREVRDKAKAAIEAGIQELRGKQEADPERYLVDHCASKIRQCFSSSTTSSKDSLETSSMEC